MEFREKNHKIWSIQPRRTIIASFYSQRTNVYQKKSSPPIRQVFWLMVLSWSFFVISFYSLFLFSWKYTRTILVHKLHFYSKVNLYNWYNFNVSTSFIFIMNNNQLDDYPPTRITLDSHRFQSGHVELGIEISIDVVRSLFPRIQF